MANMTNITVKKADAVTDIVYTALTPSAGDDTPAQWRSDTAATINAGKPVASLVSKWNGAKSVRRSDFHFVYPQVATNSTTGLMSVVNRIPIHVTAQIPQDVPDAIVAEAVAQAINLFSSTLIRDSVKTGYSPT